MTGKRVTVREDGHLYMDKGDYGKDTRGDWWVRLPMSGSSMCLLDKKYTVREESGGRITVTGVFEDEFRTSEKEADIIQYKLLSGEWREVGRRKEKVFHDGQRTVNR